MPKTASKDPAKSAPQTAAKPVAAKPAAKGDHIFLVDGSGFIFRAYHALPPLNRKSDGLQLNAVYGFCNMLWKLLRDMKPEERPTHRGGGRARRGLHAAQQLRQHAAGAAVGAEPPSGRRA